VNRRRLRQFANSLVLHEKIETSAAAGKIVRSYVEKLITKGKVDSLHAKRQLFAELNPNAARKVFEVLSPKFKERNGGYTRVLRVAPNKDGMPRVLVQFVD
jgi:large subunit ribosomal protein L17